MSQQDYENELLNAIQQYFTPDIQKRVSEMTEEEMTQALMRIQAGDDFLAILKYVQDRISFIQSNIVFIDPVASPTEIARYQGMINGLIDVRNMFIQLSAPSRNAEEANSE